MTKPNEKPEVFGNEEIHLTEDGRVPFWVTARLMAGPNPTEEEAEFWDRWKDEMKESY